MASETSKKNCPKINVAGGKGSELKSFTGERKSNHRDTIQKMHETSNEKMFGIKKSHLLSLQKTRMTIPFIMLLFCFLYFLRRQAEPSRVEDRFAFRSPAHKFREITRVRDDPIGGLQSQAKKWAMLRFITSVNIIEFAPEEKLCVHCELKKLTCSDTADPVSLPLIGRYES